MKQLTGIKGIIPDPYLNGGGLHQTIKGGYLSIHADFNNYPKLKLYRRVNVLIYLNKNWDEEYGGHLELWDRQMTRCFKKVLPIFNRCVIFNTNVDSFHGHPEPLRCPEGQSRKSIALYYYTVDKAPEDVAKGHSTLWRNRLGEKLPTGEGVIELKNKINYRTIVKKFIPPIILDFKRKVFPCSEEFN